MTKYYCLAQTKGLTASRRQLNKAAQYYHSNDAISAITFHSAFSKERSPENFRWARISVHVARACQGQVRGCRSQSIYDFQGQVMLINCVILNKLVSPFASNADIYRQHTKHNKLYKTITSFYNTNVKIIKLHIKVKFSSTTKFSFQNQVVL